MKAPPSHAIRQAGPGDRGYLMDTWLQTYRASPFAKKLPDFAYWSDFGHVGLVESIVNTVPGKVACLPDAPEFIYGYAVSDGHFLHYLFVRNEFRGQGLGRALLDAVGMAAGPLNITHLTPDFSQRLARGRTVAFTNPYRGEKKRR